MSALHCPLGYMWQSDNGVKVKVTQSYPTLCDSMEYSPWNSPGKNTGVGSLSLLQGIFPTQGSNPGLQHCRRILYQLSHKGSPRILEWVAYPFSIGSSWLGNLTSISCIAGWFFTNWAIREAQIMDCWPPIMTATAYEASNMFMLYITFRFDSNISGYIGKATCNKEE